MNTLQHLRILGIAGLLAAATPTVAQNAVTPAWGPTAPAGTEYYKLTAFNGYYNLRTKDYYYYDAGMKKWVGSDRPPAGFVGKDPKTFGAVPIAYKGTSPWREREKGTATATPVKAPPKPVAMAATPAWGPPAPAGTEYYKLTAFNGYYSLKTKDYYYYDAGMKKWVGSDRPPANFINKDPKTFGAVPIDYKGPSPWREMRANAIKAIAK